MPFPLSAGARLTAAAIDHMYAISDANVTTVTAAAYTDLSSIYPITASDAAVGTAYRLSCFGNGTTGSTAQTMQFGLNLNGTILGIAPVIGSSAFATSLAFRWKATLLYIPVSTGVTGTWVGSLEGAITEAPNNVLPNGSTQNSIGFAGGPSAAATQDTTVTVGISLRFQWGNATGAPSITCIGTTFERLG